MGAEAVKEPTMEDILASIRKIIAEDGGDQPEGVDVAPPVSADMGAEDRAQSAVPPIPADGPPNGLRMASPNAQSTNDAGEASLTPPAVERREDLEAMASSLRGSTNESAQAQPGEKPMFAPGENGLHPAIENAMAYMNKDGDPQTGGASGQVPAPMPEQLISPSQDERRSEEDRRFHPLRREADRGDDRQEAEFKGALMSPQTDHSVGNAFEDLKARIEGGMDKDVEAMLRPMLREWLDNNLPSMVERLVRDEIERVARGE